MQFKYSSVISHFHYQDTETKDLLIQWYIVHPSTWSARVRFLMLPFQVRKVGDGICVGLGPNLVMKCYSLSLLLLAKAQRLYWSIDQAQQGNPIQVRKNQPRTDTLRNSDPIIQKFQKRTAHKLFTKITTSTFSKKQKKFITKLKIIKTLDYPSLPLPGDSPTHTTQNLHLIFNHHKEPIINPRKTISNKTPNFKIKLHKNA